VPVIEAVHALQTRGPVTVNDVAAELAIDQSGASRMLTHAVEQGLPTVSRSSTDARRRIITLTSAGHDFLTAAHQWQDAMFATLTSDWTPQERNEFHRAITRLLDRSADLTHRR
jgi:DNA-binding MarR family transcriptional regulator